MHGWMLHHALEPIAAWKSLSKSRGQINGKLGTIFVRIKLETRSKSNWPTMFTSLSGMASMWQSLSEGRQRVCTQAGVSTERTGERASPSEA